MAFAKGSWGWRAWVAQVRADPEALAGWRNADSPARRAMLVAQLGLSDQPPSPQAVNDLVHLLLDQAREGAGQWWSPIVGLVSLGRWRPPPTMALDALRALLTMTEDQDLLVRQCGWQVLQALADLVRLTPDAPRAVEAAALLSTWQPPRQAPLAADLETLVARSAGTDGEQAVLHRLILVVQRLLLQWMARTFLQEGVTNRVADAAAAEAVYTLADSRQPVLSLLVLGFGRQVTQFGERGGHRVDDPEGSERWRRLEGLVGPERVDAAWRDWLRISPQASGLEAREVARVQIQGFWRTLAAEVGDILPVVVSRSVQAQYPALITLAGLESSPIVLEGDPIALTIALAEREVWEVVYVGLEEEADRFARVAGRLQIQIRQRVALDHPDIAALLAETLAASTGMKEAVLTVRRDLHDFLRNVESLAAVGA